MVKKHHLNDFASVRVRTGDEIRRVYGGGNQTAPSYKSTTEPRCYHSESRCVPLNGVELVQQIV